MDRFYSLLADLVVVVHFFYVLFAVGGLIFILLGARFGWTSARRPGFRIVHLIAVGLVALEAVVGMVCPLTNWEYDLRRMGGGPAEVHVSFVGRIVRLVIFYDLPEWVFTAAHIMFGLLVVATFVLVPPVFGAGKQKAGRK